MRILTPVDGSNQANAALDFVGTATPTSVINRDLSSMDEFLIIGAIMLLVSGLANLFIQSGALMITLSVLAIGIFSGLILYDLKRVKDGYETNLSPPRLACS